MCCDLWGVNRLFFSRDNEGKMRFFEKEIGFMYCCLWVYVIIGEILK